MGFNSGFKGLSTETNKIYRRRKYSGSKCTRKKRTPKNFDLKLLIWEKKKIKNGL